MRQNYTDRGKGCIECRRRLYTCSSLVSSLLAGAKPGGIWGLDESLHQDTKREKREIIT